MRQFQVWFATTLLLLLCMNGFAQTDKRALLQSRIQAMADTAQAKIGVGMLGLDFKDRLAVNGRQHFPMQSVFKFPLAITILARVDAGKLSLSQYVHILRWKLDTATWSPMVREFPDGDIDMTLADLLRYCVSKSDNNACDILFKLVGGPAVVDRHMHKVGTRGIAVKATEAEMKRGWLVQYSNWCEPAAMLQLLRLFYDGRLLSKERNHFLMGLMTETETGPNRIKGGLPKGTVVAHKTGTSNTNQQGITAATNDVGIITLPDGRHYVLAVFVSNYKGGVQKGEHIIAQISKLLWDYFIAK